MNIAIDGPAGAGKSTIAKKAAGELGFIYVDTGAMYRAVAVYLTESDISASDEDLVEKSIADISVEIKYEDGAQQVYLNGENVTGKLRTDILPSAELKVYLTASSAVRAKRRYDELVAKGAENIDIEKIEQDIIQRDKQDMERKTAPLKRADDAVLIDSSDMTIEQVTDTIVGLARERM